jgi:hypothetical protein
MQNWIIAHWGGVMWNDNPLHSYPMLTVAGGNTSLQCCIMNHSGMSPEFLNTGFFEKRWMPSAQFSLGFVYLLLLWMDMGQVHLLSH